MFDSGNFTLASGKQSNFKIECDDLSDNDWESLGALIASKYKFKHVLGVPRGGLKLEKYLIRYEDLSDSSLPLLIVDDVLTTGGSMEKIKSGIDKELFCDIIGVVVFARGKCPSWITSIFSTDFLS